MTLDLSYRRGPSPRVTGSRRYSTRTLESWEMEGAAAGPVAVDAHLPDSVERVVVMGHGADNSRKARYVEVAGKSFPRRGTAVIAMDAPCHGNRPDAAPLTSLPGVLPEVLQEWVRDHRLLLDAIEHRWPGVPVGFAGFSMGGLYGVPLMAVDRRVRSAAIVIAGSTRVSYPLRLDLDRVTLDVLDVTDPVVHAAGFGRRPVLLLNADSDEIVPREAGLALYDAFRGPKEIVFMPGTHTEWGHAARWFRRLEQFFLETLKS